MSAFLEHPSILDEFGRAIPKSGKVRSELVDAFVAAQNNKRRPIAATYDGAESGDDTVNYWANTDGLDADAANSFSVRQKLVRRSRYDTASNGIADGICKTMATDIVGKGPSLRMQTGSEGFNRMVEREWNAWAKEIKFRRKLWCLAHAYDQDGEGFGVIRQNRNLRHAVKIDLQLTEAEQCHTPYLPYNQPGKIDGIEFDEFGNATAYEFLKHHPGSSNSINAWAETERVSARFVCHWFSMIRPGQHRGIPAGTSTLNIGAAARRWREATLGAAENVANFSLFIKTMFEPDEVDAVTPMSSLDIQKRMMVALPAGYDAFQPKAEQPTANHGEFNKALISEQARPRSMPYNKAACDSSSHNFASGRLDHIPYFQGIDHVHRLDCNDLVLEPLFDVWFDLAVLAFGWLGGNPTVIRDGAKLHTWDWPKHTIADEKSEAAAKDTKLKNGSTSLVDIANECGDDYEDKIVRDAEANGLTPDDQRKWNFVMNLPQTMQQGAAQKLGLIDTAPLPQPVAAGPQTEDEPDDET